MATRRTKSPSHVGGSGRDGYKGNLTAPLTPAERKKYAHLLGKKNGKKK